MATTHNDPVLQTEAEAGAFLRELRWPNGPFCPYCRETDDLVAVSQADHPLAPHRCGTCRAEFTIVTGSVMERSRIPLQKWPVLLRQLETDRHLPLDRLMLKQFSPTASDPDLRLWVDERAVRPAAVHRRAYIYRLTQGARDVAAISRHIIPADHAGLGKDARRLGVCILKIRATSDQFEQVWHWDDPLLLDGFYQPEGGHRWTNGHARLPALNDAHRGRLEIEIQLADAPLNYRL